MRVSWIAALCLLAAGPAATKPYQIEDMLKLQSYGKALLSPDGQWCSTAIWMRTRDNEDENPVCWDRRGA